MFCAVWPPKTHTTATKPRSGLVPSNLAGELFRIFSTGAVLCTKTITR